GKNHLLAAIPDADDHCTAPTSYCPRMAQSGPSFQSGDETYLLDELIGCLQRMGFYDCAAWAQEEIERGDLLDRFLARAGDLEPTLPLNRHERLEVLASIVVELWDYAEHARSLALSCAAPGPRLRPSELAQRSGKTLRVAHT
ncbi:MAG: hypothetical protein ACRDPA_11510, partial [Solirubrobacteraceae bacterium]